MENDGFESKKLGFGVYRDLEDGQYLEEVNVVVAFNTHCSHAAAPNVDDIIAYYLGNDDMKPATSFFKRLFGKQHK